ncbi:molybdate ABC transporter substrate-binding protein [Kordiimonas aquimaris]|uniref:molybdate ABC transporter substrate-binding protein n=1 Tax=Kordiimonas aquimaris TaxID=707591 RepID=UPI0021D11FE4|nr:molybdate ABC transporter substrate-binding protein [Kordiimonas aquimaris]
MKRILKVFNQLNKAHWLISLVIVSMCFAYASLPVAADTVHVAVASNFLKPAQDIKIQFERETNHSVILSAASTGQLYNQITQGAPFDVFLAADQMRPLLLSQHGLAVKNSQYTYAYGKLALYSANSSSEINATSLTDIKYQRLAIANPNTAPYGAAAIQVLKSLDLLSQTEPLLVRGANIAQAYQFVETGNADVGLVALAQVINRPATTIWRVPQTHYTPIAQDFVLLEHGRLNATASEFLHFLKSSKAGMLIKKYGYDVDLQAK